MAEVQTQAPPVNSTAKKKKARKRMKNAIIALVVVALIAAAGFAIWWLVFREAEKSREILTDFAYRSSISSMVNGSGTARAADSATITLAAAGTVLEVYIADGDFVNEGDPLYVIDSAAANKAVLDAEARVEQRLEALVKTQERLSELYDELDELLDEQASSERDRFLRAPFSGQMRDTAELSLGDAVTRGTLLARLVDDSRFRLSLYFSYAFEQDIFIGQSASVSITAAMLNLTGRVEEIRKVRRVTAEGATLFEVVLVVENPGALTDGMSATASLTAVDGSAILPYESGALAFYRTAEIRAKTSGDVVETNLLSYGDITEGAVMAALSAEDFAGTLQAKRDEIKLGQEAVDSAAALVEEAAEEVTRAEDALADFSAVAPMSGTVLSCSLRPGEEVEGGRVAITIADVSVMTVDVQIDERNVSYVKPGMFLNFNDWYGNMYMGTVESVSLTGENNGGITTFPAVVKVENYAGTLMTGMWLEYSFAAAQSEDCLVIPIQCVRYLPAEDGSNTTVVFLKADLRPDYALELTPDVAKDVPEGFYAVPVSTGLSDNMNVEITEGLNDMDEIFNNYMTDQANGWGW